MSELNREQIIKALKCCHSHTYKNCPKCPYNEHTDTEKSCFMRLMEDALALIKELTKENERLRSELEQRPPRLAITKLQKGNNDENSKDTAALQECEADHHI